MATKIVSDTELVTPPVRLHFPSLFVARAIPGATKETYQAVALLPPDIDLKPFKVAMKNALVAKFGTKFKLPASKNPIHDAMEKDYDGFVEGWHFINLNANYPPMVVRRNKQQILDAKKLVGKPQEEQEAAIAEAEQQIFAGCWVRFHLNCYAWDHPTGGRGVSFGLKAVQLDRTDEAFSTGASNNADAFEELDDEEEDDSFGESGGDDDDEGGSWLD